MTDFILTAFMAQSPETKGRTMADETEEYIRQHWHTINEAVDILAGRGIEMSVTGIRSAVVRGRLRARKIGGLYRGEWRVDPASLKAFKKHKHRRKD